MQVILLWQEVKDIDWVKRDGRDKGEEESIGRGKSGLFIEGFEGKIELIDIGK